MSSTTNTWLQRINFICSILLYWVWYRKQGEIEPLIGIISSIAALIATFPTNGQLERRFLERIRELTSLGTGLFTQNIGINKSKTIITLGVMGQTIIGLSVAIAAITTQLFGLGDVPNVPIGRIGVSISELQGWMGLAIMGASLINFTLILFGIYKWSTSQGQL